MNTFDDGACHEEQAFIRSDALLATPVMSRTFFKVLSKRAFERDVVEGLNTMRVVRCGTRLI